MAEDAGSGGARALGLPAFPWDSLVPYREQARAHPGGLIDLSVGTPVDPTPPIVREALAGAADAPGYPTTQGTAAVREAAAGWLRRRFGIGTVDPETGVLPSIGSKELVAWLPTLLGLHDGDVVVHPELAYPTYDIGARLAGARPLAADSSVALGPQRPALVWLNSPANPHGRILPAEHLAKMVAWARERGAVIAADECYLEFCWDASPVSVLDPAVNGGSLDGVLAVHSLSKRSNLAGYRAGFVAGDPALLKRLLEIRRHAGMMMPAPVQAAMAAALDDDQHVDEQRSRYHRRRAVLREALGAAGFRIDHSEGSLYLWATRDEPCWETVGRLAERGILVAPGEYYGPPGRSHVRVALTATDEHIAAAADRLTA
ncbi:succinyldiaminopimelate transaminase [Phytoactinopolyspora endophytica]|uniref:succinyldiaminopimelate transaminase n=1 Tax=Phytoactinopolyspora endophytica TaxID=1642495 RepID=UPI00101C256B|nr:succinyldiaminopimelate transaminase [Phytoactinopolyspora endophytica]